MRRKGGSGASPSGSSGSGGGGAVKPPFPALLSKLIFSKGTKMEKSKEGAEGMVVEVELLNCVEDGRSKKVEWLGNFGASRHVCNNMSL